MTSGIVKSAALGCMGGFVGLLIGVALTVGFFSLGIKQSIETPIPAPLASQRDVTITASAAFINSQIQQVAKQTNMLKQTNVTLNVPNIVKVATVVDATVLGQRITSSATATMRVSVKSGRIALAVDQVNSGNPLVPASMMSSAVENIRAQMENQINVLVQRGLQGTGLRLTTVRVTPSEMMIDLSAQ